MASASCTRRWRARRPASAASWTCPTLSPTSRISAAALVILGERDEALGQAWHVPNDRPQITQRQFAELVFAETGHPVKASGMGKLMLALGGLFIPAARESVEMLYEFEKPFVVESSKFERTFGVQATPIEEAIKVTVAWYRAHPQGK